MKKQLFVMLTLSFFISVNAQHEMPSSRYPVSRPDEGPPRADLHASKDHHLPNKVANYAVFGGLGSLGVGGSLRLWVLREKAQLKKVVSQLKNADDSKRVHLEKRKQIIQKRIKNLLLASKILLGLGGLATLGGAGVAAWDYSANKDKYEGRFFNKRGAPQPTMLDRLLTAAGVIKPQENPLVEDLDFFIRAKRAFIDPEDADEFEERLKSKGLSFKKEQNSTTGPVMFMLEDTSSGSDDETIV